jgi:hypothetical protein
LQSASTDVDVAISSYADGNGTYAAFGANHYLNSGGNDAVFDATKRSAYVFVDGRNLGGVVFGTAASGTATERMRIDSSGNVGIGETLPTAPLQIKNTSAGASTVGLFLTNSDVTADTEVRLAFAAHTNTDIASNRYSYISAINTSGSNGQALRFATNETGASAVERMRIDSSGNVGIGTSSPSDTSGYGRALDIQSSTGAAVYLRDSDAPTTDYGVVAYDSSIDSLTLGSVTASTGRIRFISAGSEAARIDSSGNVGIGLTPTSYAGQKSLNISGYDGNYALSLGASGSNYGTIGYNVGYSASASTYNYQVGDKASMIRFANGGFEFNTTSTTGTAGNAITFTPAMTIANSGKVGINETDPQLTLHVNSGTTNVVSVFESTDANAYISLKDNSTSDESQVLVGAEANEMLLYAGGSERMRIDDIGNAGIGKTPPAWNTGFGPALHVGGGAALWSRSDLRTSLGSNWYVGTSGGSAESFRIGTGQASQYLQLQGKHLFYIAGSNSAGTVISGTQAMTLDNDGNFLLNISSKDETPSTTGGTNNLQWVENGTSNRVLLLVQSHVGDGIVKLNVTFNDTSTRDAIRFYRTGVQVGSISCSTTATAYNTSSDYRLKENIVDASSASDVIDAIQVRQFDWKADGSHQRYGMVAQELLEVAPEAVSAPEDLDEMMSVDYSKLVPMLVKEIQELRARVHALESE